MDGEEKKKFVLSSYLLRWNKLNITRYLMKIIQKRLNTNHELIIKKKKKKKKRKARNYL